MSTPSWSQQITQTRLGRPAEAQVGRNDAQRDFDRIVFSSPFRRLQGKTQVFPLPETDTTHTRLTHSLEAACVGRSLGYLVGRQLPEVAEDARVVGDIVAAAALAHDLGNPPFGHSGESAIASFFQEAEERGAPWFEALTPVQRTELQEFEGNALGFRLLTRVGGQPGGFGLTHGTLAAFSKYPCSAARPRGEGVATKKYGVFHDDLGWFQQVAAGVGLTPLPGASDAWCRPALAFLTEAADDICYRIIDLEDGYKLRLVTYEEARAAFVEIAEQTSQNLDPLSSFRSDEERIAFLRARAINSLIEQVVEGFLADQARILSGTREVSLLDTVPSDEVLCRIQRLSLERVYAQRRVLEIEAAGYEILPYLLETFLPAVLTPRELGSSKTKLTPRQKKHRMLLPRELRDADPSVVPLATRILNLCQVVGSMTDEYAINTYRTLRGIALPRSHY